jgi:hypothetical protein
MLSIGLLGKTASKALLVIFLISLSAYVSSSAVASLDDSECEKLFSRGVEIYELGLQVRLLLLPFVSVNWSPIFSCEHLSQMILSTLKML